MSAAKRMKMDPELIQSKSETANIGFDSLDDECIKNIFDWLPLNDFCRLRVTCKRLYVLANEHYRWTYGQLVASYDANFDEDGVKNVNTNKYRRSFASLAQKVVCKHGVENVSDMSSKLNQNVKSIDFWSFDLSADSNDVHLKEQLHNVEAISSRILSDNFLQLFSNLEYITFTYFDSKRLGQLSGTYPKLKQFDWKDSKIRKKPKMESFFKRNPNVKVFSSNTPINTTNWLLESNITFDDLVLEIEPLTESNEDVNIIFENIHSLHKNRQFEKLHLKIHRKEFLLSKKLTKLTFVEGIEVNVLEHNENILKAITALPNLKLLIFNEKCQLCKHDFELIAQNLQKLEEFHTNAFDHFQDVIPFVRHSAKLKCIYIDACPDSEFEITTTLQILDKKRRQLQNACKLTIYMKEVYYMQMKENSSTSSYGLVEIKRTDSYPLSKHPLRPKYRTA